MDIIKEYKIEFPSERVFISEDIIWDSEYYKYSNRTVVIDSIAYNYRITPGSLTKKYKPDMLERICFLYNEMNKRLDNDNNKIMRLQRQFFVNLRTCIKQEKNTISKKSDEEIIMAISKIVNHNVVCSVSEEYLKIIKQGKQKVFVWAVRNKCVKLLWLFNKTGRL